LQNKPGTVAHRPPSQPRGGIITQPSLDDVVDHELEPSDDEYPNTQTHRVQSLQDTLNELNLNHRFFGKSSGANLALTALDLKSEYNGNERDHAALANRRPEFWTQESVRAPLTATHFAPLIRQHSGNVPLTAPTRLITPFQSRT
jgi:hypothetical protein